MADELRALARAAFDRAFVAVIIAAATILSITALFIRLRSAPACLFAGDSR